jgi:hypothetical protein
MAVPFYPTACHFNKRKTDPKKALTSAEAISEHTRFGSAIRHITEFISKTTIPWIFNEDRIRSIWQPIPWQVQSVPHFALLPPGCNILNSFPGGCFAASQFWNHKISWHRMNIVIGNNGESTPKRKRKTTNLKAQ